MNRTVDARGYFWWADAEVEDGNWAPGDAVSGRLTVDAQGLAKLDLDMPLPRGEGPGRMAILFEKELPHSAISGVLTGSEERVRVWDLLKGPSHLATKGPSHEQFVGQRCLIGRNLDIVGLEPEFDTLICPLEDYDEWLGPGFIDVQIGPTTTTAVFERGAPRSWSGHRFQIEIRPSLRGGGDGRANRVEWTVIPELSLHGATMTVESAIELAGRIEDFLVLLTDSERGLPFPSLAVGASSPVRLFYARTSRPEAPVKWHHAWVNFPQVADEFGGLLHRWLEIYDRYGPGIHLYLGNRRGSRTYTEFRFAAFVWGLEAMHRRDTPTAANTKLKDKVERILGNILLERDRRWARTKLPTTEEPPLSTRIFEVLRALPIGLDPEQLNAFAQRCTQRRNDISHFGGARDDGDYDDFIDEVSALTDALDLLYHARILHLMGLAPEKLWWWFVDGYREYPMRRTLEAAGLSVPDGGTPFPEAT